MAIDVQISTKTIKSCCLIFWSHDAEIYLIYIFRKIDICWVDTFTFECNGRKLRSLFVVRDTDKTATFKLELPETDWGVYLHSKGRFLSESVMNFSNCQTNMPNHYLKLEFLKLHFVCFCFAADFQANPTDISSKKAVKFKRQV